MNSKNPIQTIPFLDTVSEHIYKREFRKAEDIVLEKIEAVAKESEKLDVLDRVDHMDDIKLFHTLYSSFNKYYLRYVERKGVDTGDERDDLRMEDHDNYFIAHCSDPADMDDMLYELINHLMDSVGNTHDDISTHINCYRKHFA